MSIATTYAHIVRTPGNCGGRPRIVGHRVRVQDVAVEHEVHGFSPEEICEQHPGLTLAEVHSALAFFYDHREAILEDLRRDEEIVEEFKRNFPVSSR